MKLRVTLASLATCLALTALAAWLFDMPFDQAAALAPVIVVACGAAAFVVLIWVRVALEPLRRRRDVR